MVEDKGTYKELYKVSGITEDREEEEGAPGNENISAKAQQYPFARGAGGGGSSLCVRI